MKITGEHDFTAARDAVWNGLHDPQVLAATMPGAHRLDPTGPNEYVITVSVGVGSVKGTYDGVFAVTDTADGEACTVRATASGRPGSVETVAQMQLSDGERRRAHGVRGGGDGHRSARGRRPAPDGARPRAGRPSSSSARSTRISSPRRRPSRRPPPPSPVRRSSPRGRAATDARVIVTSALAGFVLALIGVAVGRWTARN